MKKYSILFVLLFLFLFSASTQAEEMYDFINLLRPFVTDIDTYQYKTVNQIESYVKNLSGFSCKRTNFSDRRSRISCRSDKDKYIGSYNIFFSFDRFEVIQFMEIQASHPNIDKTLSKSQFGLDYYAKYVSWMIKNRADFITKTKYKFPSDLTLGIFSTNYTKVQECMELNDTSNILCVAYKEKSQASEKNQYLLSLTTNKFFYARPVY